MTQPPLLVFIEGLKPSLFRFFAVMISHHERYNEDGLECIFKLHPALVNE